MKQAWGWLMAGVVAAGLNASYHDGGLRMVHGMVARTGHNVEAVLALASGRADQFLTEARLATTREETSSCQLATALARAQTRVTRSETEFARWEAMSDREQAQWDRLEASRARIEAKVASIRIPVVNPAVFVNASVPTVCPRIRVNIPQPPAIKIPSIPAIPVVHIASSDNGPI